MLEKGVDDDVNQALVAMLDAGGPGDWNGEVEELILPQLSHR